MKKRILLTGITALAVAIGVVGMSAFEAHIINVTAQIENALAVSTNEIEFGTVFPQEYMVEQVDIRLSDSFIAEDRVDDIEYILKQKPKPRHEPARQLPILKPDYNMYLAGGQFEGQLYPNWIDNDHQRGEYCHTHLPADASDPMDTYYINCYPSLCEYLSKHDADPEDQNDGPDIPALHDPGVTLVGYLSKDAGDVVDLWDIDLVVPCFEGQCAQDWPEFVAQHNDTVDPFDYVLPPTLEHEVFGCDLWFEVTGISLPQDPVTELTVIKQVINDDQTADKIASDFTINVSGTNVSNPSFPGAEAPGTTVTLDPGAFSVTEDADAEYSTSYVGDCDGTINEGESLTCTVINDDLPQVTGTIEIIKTVVNNGIGTLSAADFQMEIDGVDVPQNSPNVVPVGIRTVGEEAQAGYEMTFTGGDCDSNGDIDVQDGQVYTCEVTNTYTEWGTITVTKEVIIDDGGLKTIGDFALYVNGDPVTSGVPVNVAAGDHVVSEDGIFGYDADFTVDCDNAGNVNVAAGEDKACTIINDDIAPSISLVKTVVGGGADPDDFDLAIDSVIITSGASRSVLANSPHSLDELVPDPNGLDFNFVSMTGTSFRGVPCPTNLGETITLEPGDVVTCTITNEQQ